MTTTYDRMTDDQLRTLARQRGLVVPRNSDRDTVIRMLDRQSIRDWFQR